MVGLRATLWGAGIEPRQPPIRQVSVSGSLLAPGDCQNPKKGCRGPGLDLGQSRKPPSSLEILSLLRTWDLLPVCVPHLLALQP